MKRSLVLIGAAGVLYCAVTPRDGETRRYERFVQRSRRRTEARSTGVFVK